MIKRHCLHCYVFNEVRQEMRTDLAHMEIWQNPMTRAIYRKLMAECPRCRSIEYFFDGELKEQTKLDLEQAIGSGFFEHLE